MTVGNWKSLNSTLEKKNKKNISVIRRVYYMCTNLTSNLPGDRQLKRSHVPHCKRKLHRPYLISHISLVTSFYSYSLSWTFTPNAGFRGWRGWGSSILKDLTLELIIVRSTTTSMVLFLIINSPHTSNTSAVQSPLHPSPPQEKIIPTINSPRSSSSLPLNGHWLARNSPGFLPPPICDAKSG